MLRCLLIGFALLAQNQLEVPQGFTAWVITGLMSMIASVAGWFALKHLPAKDKLIADLVSANNERFDRRDESNRAERIKESDARHAMANEFQKVIFDIILENKKQLIETQQKFLEALDGERKESDRRNDMLLLAVTQQTRELREAIHANRCGFRGVNEEPVKK